jgi:hypothetical protein
MNTKEFLLFCLLLVIFNPIQCIKAEKFVVYDESFSLDPNEYIWCSFNITSLPVYGHFEVTCNTELDLYIMNESDSQKWFAGETEIYAFYREVRNTSFSFTFSGTGIWLVVLDNTKTTNIVKNGHLTITLSDQRIFDIRDYPQRVKDQRFVYQSPGLPGWVLLVAGLAVFLSFIGSIVYVKFLTKRQIRVVIKNNSFN